MHPDHFLRFEPATVADLQDSLVCEMFTIPEPVRFVTAMAIRIERGLDCRLGPSVVEEIGRALGLEPAECRHASALAGYLSQRHEDGRIRSYADASTAGLEDNPLLPSCFERLTPQEAQAIAIHRELDGQIRPRTN